MIPMAREPRTGLAFTTALWLCVAILTCLFVIGCGSTPSTCQELDWYEIGRRDGSKGLVKNARRNVKPVCGESDQSLSEALYHNGFDAGVAQYCSPSRGFEMGRADVEVQGLCPTLLEGEFMRAYQRGKRLLELENQQSSINRRIQALDRDLRDRGVDLVRRGAIEGERLELLQQKEKLHQEISRLQTTPTES